TRLAKSSYSPSWSPGSRRLAFSSNLRGPLSIYTIGVDGTGLRQLTTNGEDVDPAWSPDGKTIAFSRGGAIVTVPIGRGAEKTLTDAKNNDSSPAWNPVVG